MELTHSPKCQTVPLISDLRLSRVLGDRTTINETRSALTSSRYLQIDDSVGANALHGVEFQIPLEVSGVEPRNRQTVAKTSLGGRGREFNFPDVPEKV